MGYIRHDAIVVTSWNFKQLEAAATQAKILGLQVLGPSEQAINEYSSILICPDGSKEGWIESKLFNDLRQKFIEYLKSMRHDDGSSCFDWVAVSYGSDDRDAAITTHEWADSQPVES